MLSNSICIIIIIITIIITLNQENNEINNLYSSKMEDEMQHVCWIRYKILVLKRQEKEHFGDLGEDRKTVLK
jgi:hypothetical protein